MARCPSCDDALTGTVHDEVHLSLCNGCGATWATLAQLEELHGGQVSVKVYKAGQTKHRCAICRLELKRAKLDDRVDAEYCKTCKAAFFEAGGLSKFKPLNIAVGVARKAGMFVCVMCGKDTPKTEGTVRAAGLACRKCAGLDGQAAGWAAEDPSDKMVDWARDNPEKPVNWAINAMWLTFIFLVLVGAYCAAPR
jgi:Zn-finger nucleic acid-binding protein